MSRLRNARRSSLLAAPILAALSGGLMAALTPSSSQATTQAAPAKGEWFREEPPRAPGDLSGATAPPAAAEPTDVAPAAPADAAAPAGPPAVAVVAPAAPAPAPAAPLAPAAPANDTPRRPFTPGNVAVGYGAYGGYTDYPASEVYNYVVAQTRAATARAMFRRAEGELATAFRDARRQFENSREYLDAVREESVAYAELNNTRRKSLRSLANDVKYQHLALLRQDLTDQLARRRAAHDISQEEVFAMATLKMSYAVDMRAMEAEVLAGDGGQVRGAQDRLVAAGSRVAGLRARYDESLRTSPEIVAARRNLEDARIARITSDAYLQAAAYAGDQALDYAYYLHRRSGYNVADYGYNAGAYGYGLRY